MDLEYYKKNALPGYHFLPEDGDMLDYLHWRKEGHHPFANFFKDVPLYDYDPDELQSKFGHGKEDELYVFFKSSKPLKGSRMGRKARNGRWKVTIGDRKIASHAGNQMGYKKKLLFVRDGNEETTGWNMVEYRLALMDNLFLCKIYKSRKSCESLEDENLSMSSMVENEVNMSITSSHDPVQCSTNFTYQKTSSPINSNFVEAARELEPSSVDSEIDWEPYLHDCDLVLPITSNGSLLYEDISMGIEEYAHSPFWK